MPIPQGILPVHIAKAIKELKKLPYDPKQASTVYCVLAEGTALEMKRIISKAAKIGLNIDLGYDDFTSGEARKYLAKLGFQAVLGATK